MLDTMNDAKCLEALFRTLDPEPKIRCPSCGKHLDKAARLANSSGTVQCPGCRTRFSLGPVSPWHGTLRP